jgi:outer membrane protein TolC
LWSTALELDTSGRLRAALARARADEDAAAANLALAQRDLRRAVAAHYFRLLLARRLVRVAQDALVEAQRFERRTQLLFDNGEVAQADLFKASSQVAFLEQALNAAELEAQVANQDLASFWTTAVNEALPLLDVLDQPVPPPEAEPAGKGATTPAPFMRRPEFDLLNAQRRSFLADARRARAELLPQASLIFQYGVDAPHLQIRDRGYAAFVYLNFPIFDWLRARSLARQFELRAQQVETNRAMAERTFSRDYQNALARVKQIYQQIALTENQLKFSAENLRLSRVCYEGVRDWRSTWWPLRINWPKRTRTITRPWPII